MGGGGGRGVVAHTAIVAAVENDDAPGLKAIRSGGVWAIQPRASGRTLADPTVPIDGAVEPQHVLAGLVGGRVADPGAGHVAVVAVKRLKPTRPNSVPTSCPTSLTSPTIPNTDSIS